MTMQRKIVGRKGSWLSQVTPGVPFTLIEGVQPVEAATPKRKPRLSARTLRDLGELWTVAQVAEYLKVCPSAVYGWIYDKKIKPTYLNKRIRIAMCDLEEFLALA